jgi:hypothetical protein
LSVFSGLSVWQWLCYENGIHNHMLGIADLAVRHVASSSAIGSVFMIRDKDGKLGLRQESAAAITLRDTIAQHMHAFSHVIRDDREAGAAVVAAYIDGLAGAVALTVHGGHGSRDEVNVGVQLKLKDAVARDLAHLAGIITVK